MLASDLAHLEGCVGLRLNPDLSHAAGLTVYHLVTDPSKLAADPDLPIFPSREAAIRRLSKASRPPAGTTRLLDVATLDYTLQRKLRRHISYSINNDSIVSFNTPIIIDGHSLSLDSFTSFPSLPCLSDETRSTLLRRFPNTLVARQKSLLLGLPCITKPRLTKSGKPRASQAKSFASSREAFLHDRGALLPDDLFTFLTDHLHATFTFHHTVPSGYNRPSLLHKKDLTERGTPAKVHFYHSFYPAIRTENRDPTWVQIARAHAARANKAATFLGAFIPNHPWRSIAPTSVYYLVRTHRVPYLLRALSVLTPFLPWLKSGYPPEHTKLNRYDSDQLARSFRSFHNKAYLLLHTYARNTPFPDPNTFFPDYPDDPDAVAAWFTINTNPDTSKFHAHLLPNAPLPLPFTTRCPIL